MTISLGGWAGASDTIDSARSRDAMRAVSFVSMGR